MKVFIRFTAKGHAAIFTHLYSNQPESNTETRQIVSLVSKHVDRLGVIPVAKLRKEPIYWRTVKNEKILFFTGDIGCECNRGRVNWEKEQPFFSVSGRYFTSGKPLFSVV